MDYLTDPASIPSHGERLNQTLLDVGTGKSWDQRNSEKAKAVIIKSVVDEGPRVKKKLSAPFFEGQMDQLREFRKAIGCKKLGFSHIPFDNEGQLHSLLTPMLEKVRNTRFSAMVRPVEFETDKGRYVRYEQAFFTPPTQDAEIHMKSEPTQFKR